MGIPPLVRQPSRRESILPRARFRSPPIFRVEARLSFPSKLSSYVASGGAVFIHAPGYASPALFHEQYPVGISCRSLKGEDIVTALERVVEDDSLRQRAAAARTAALQNELGMHVMLERFFEFSGVDLRDSKRLAC